MLPNISSASFTLSRKSVPAHPVTENYSPLVPLGTVVVFE